MSYENTVGRARRRDEAYAVADTLGVDREDLWIAACAIWSNLNPQSTPWAIALSAACAALAAMSRAETERSAT